MNFFFLIFLLISNIFASAPEDCPSFDFSSRFGPIRDQGGHGLCWAFASSGLFEEQACLRDSSYCGKSFSPLDVSRCQWKVGKEDEGSYVVDAAKCVLGQEGLCYEVDAPFYETFRASCLGSSIIGLNEAFVTRCFTEELVHFYRRWKKDLSTNEVCEYNQSPLESDQDFPKIMRILTQYKTLTEARDNEGFNIRVDPLKSLLSAKDEWDFLKQILIPVSCIENRVKFKGEPVYTYDLDYEKMNNNPRDHAKFWQTKLVEAFRANRSAALSFCTTMDGPIRPLEKFFKRGKMIKECEGHALIANGMRWNASSNRCEIHLKNSWGELAPYNGWVTAEDILKATYSTTYIK